MRIKSIFLVLVLVLVVMGDDGVVSLSGTQWNRFCDDVICSFCSSRIFLNHRLMFKNRRKKHVMKCAGMQEINLVEVVGVEQRYEMRVRYECEVCGSVLVRSKEQLIIGVED